jgi:hypothetical protein
MSYAYMKRDELSAQIEQLLQGGRAGRRRRRCTLRQGRRGDERRRNCSAPRAVARIRQLKAELEAEAKAQKEAVEAAAASERDDHRDDDHRDPPGPTPLPTHKVPTTADGTPTDKAQRNFTDGDSRIMKTGDGFVQGYNCQSVVDEAHQIIVAQEVTNQPPDVEHLRPMLEQTIANCAAVPDEMTADAGFLSEANIIGAIERGVDRTSRWKAQARCAPDRPRSPPTTSLTELMTKVGHPPAPRSARRRPSPSRPSARSKSRLPPIPAPRHRQSTRRVVAITATHRSSSIRRPWRECRIPIDRVIRASSSCLYGMMKKLVKTTHALCP